MSFWWWVLIAVGVVLTVVAIYDLAQRRHAILRVFPLVGHLRFVLESIGPELRQYIVTSNNEEKPFNRDERRWIYSGAKDEDTYFGFGTDNDLEHSPGYVIVRHSAFPIAAPSASSSAGGPAHALPVAKVLGAARNRNNSFRMPSAVNISSMSFGSLSGPAVEALNRGATTAGVLHGTGEGGVSAHHLHGGELIWQIGTSYFGCRDEHGAFSVERFRDVVAATPSVRAIEVKLSQGAKAGLGGLLPAAKITPEIAASRGIPLGVDCASPPSHTAFSSVDEMLDFVELLATESGLPVGIKSAVGDLWFWRKLADLMTARDRGVDFITIDGGEGGSGAAPLSFSDHVGMPFKLGFSSVYGIFAEHGLTDRVVFMGSGRLGLPHIALFAFALGCDSINVGRETMLALGCIQAQRCHTGRCPTGVTTQSRWRGRGVDPETKSDRVASYLIQLRKEILQLSRACGVEHPALVAPGDLEILEDGFAHRSVGDTFGYQPDWGRPGAQDQADVVQLMQP